MFNYTLFSVESIANAFCVKLVHLVPAENKAILSSPNRRSIYPFSLTTIDSPQFIACAIAYHLRL